MSSSGNSLNYVRFDVGHYLYVCHKSTIMKFENSVLAKYVAPHFDRRKSEFDYIVIDRDGKHFGSIINFMRDSNSLDLNEWHSSDLTDLMREADFYCLTNLVELCEKQFEIRKSKLQEQQQQESFVVPANRRLEIIYGYDVMKELLDTSDRPTIVISYRSVRRFHIDSWIEELVKLCDHSRFRVYCFANKGDESCDRGLTEFIMSLYNPEERRFTRILQAPPYEKFRSKRDYYKCKTFKFWFLIQNDLV